LTKGSSSTVRRSLATAAYVGAVTFFLGGSLWLIDDLRSSSVRLSQTSFRLAELVRRARRPAHRIDEAGQRLFLGGRTMTIAAAALEQRIKDTVERSGGELTSSQVEPDSPDAKNGVVRLTASIEVDQSGVQKILYEIEAGTPYLFVDKLSVQSPEDLGEPDTGRFRMTLAVLGQWRSFE
jgi:general secretion pathway protein M